MCQACDGQRFFRYDVPPDHAWFGRLFPCPVCNQATIEFDCGLTTGERRITVGDIDINERPGAANMKAEVERFISNPVGFLSIYGSWGNGKTIALQAIVNHFVDSGLEARYITAQELQLYLREAFDPVVMETDIGRIRKLANIPVLCIDEFDKLQKTEYATAMQQHLINERYRNAMTLGTVFAWNGGMTAIPWPAVTSRMSEFVIVSNNDPDMRPLLGRSL